MLIVSTILQSSTKHIIAVVLMLSNIIITILLLLILQYYSTVALCSSSSSTVVNAENCLVNAPSLTVYDPPLTRKSLLIGSGSKSKVISILRTTSSTVI